MPGMAVGLSQCCLTSTAFAKAKSTAYHLLRPCGCGGRLSNKATAHSSRPQRILVDRLLAVPMVPLRTMSTAADRCSLAPPFGQCVRVCQCLPLEEFRNILWSSPSILLTSLINSGSCWASPITSHCSWDCPCLTHRFLTLPPTPTIRSLRGDTGVCIYMCVCV